MSRYSRQSMAPKSRRAPHLELREPELPPPLRIIKRGQTVTGCSSPREVEHGGRGISAGSDESRGSPPMTVDRPLTVHKRRGARGSVLDGSFGEPSPETSSDGSTIYDLIKKNAERNFMEDTDLTPKAVRQLPRITSAGAFLKAEFHSLRDKRGSNGSDRTRMSHEQVGRVSPPKIPERRLSKSKNFFLKLGGRKDNEPKSIQRVGSSTSKNTLMRRLSCGTNRDSGMDSPYTDIIASADSSYSLERITSGDIADVIIDSRISSYDSSSLHSLSPGSMQSWPTSAKEEFLLCPEITITPEVLSLDAGSTNIWVAIEVAGTLRLANTHEKGLAKLKEGRRTISGHSAAHLRNFGRLHSMRIDLITTRDSSVLEVIGNLHESKTVYAGETHLILSKLRIAKVTKAASHIQKSSTSEDIMADLESHLCGAITSYLTVRLTYKHSGFLNFKTTVNDWEGAMSSHSTRLQTEASAAIKRLNLESAWSPRTSGEMNGPVEVNPLIKLIEMHLPTDKARDAIRKLANDRTPIPVARRLNGTDNSGASIEATVNAHTGGNVAARIDSAVTMSLLRPQFDTLTPNDPDTLPLTTPVSRSLRCKSEVDPARKIWTEMRKNSRGYRHYRNSISEGHYSNDSDDCSPSRLSSADTVDEERQKIMNIALKNKRSVGADTLKSFAPSVGKVRGGTIGALGLGAGRSWWVGGSWW